MLKQLTEFIIKQKLFKKEDAIMLTVSGGIDSVVMCDLFYKAGFFFGIAHCNFKLRGKESDEDEVFVKSLSKKYKVPFHSKNFDTESDSKKKKKSIQMSARDLRYAWFNKIAKEKKYDFIATAHHLDDSIETFFINILRGTGITGLQGVPIKLGKIIRPLLFANKTMIRNYAKEENLLWREDSSNFTDKYLRNNIRHHIIPSLKKLNAGFEKTIAKELSYLKDAGEIFKKFIEEKKREVVVKEGKNILFNIKKLKDSGYAETILHELLRAYNFSPETTELIAKRMYTTAGKKFLSPTYRLIKDRNFLILTPKSVDKEKKASLLKKHQNSFNNQHLHLKIEIMDGGLSQIIDKSIHIAYLDYSTLVFPLRIRKWKQGDFFYPLGMNGKKKLSDFLIDQKIPISEKENVYVLESGKKIAWIINYRLDNRFKILPVTNKILKISPAD